MKARAIALAITLTALFFIPMTALPTEEAPQRSTGSEAPAEPSQSAAESALQSESSAEQAKSFTESSFRIYDLSTKEIYEVSAADYVRGAIAAEMGADFEYAALVAQGRAAFSCALYQKNVHSAADYDFTADPQNRFMFVTEEQVYEIYGDAFDEKWARISAAATEAMTAVITYDNAPAMTVYHAISAGKTQSAADIWGGELPYLTEVESPWDANNEGFLSEATYPKNKVLEALNAYGANLSGGAPEEWFAGGEYTPAATCAAYKSARRPSPARSCAPCSGCAPPHSPSATCTANLPSACAATATAWGFRRWAPTPWRSRALPPRKFWRTTTPAPSVLPCRVRIVKLFV